MKVKKRAFLLICWIVLSLLGCTLLWQSTAEYVYQHPFLIAENEQYTVVVDDNDIETNIIQLDQNNRVVNQISYDRLDTTAFHLALKLLYANNAWYLIEAYNYIGASDSHYALYYLDFDRQSMVLVYDNFSDLCLQEAIDNGYSFGIPYSIPCYMQDDALFVQGYGIADDRQYHYLLFRIQNGTCTLAESQPVQTEIRAVAKLGGEEIFLFQYDPGLYYGTTSLSENYFSLLTTSKEGQVYALDQTIGEFRRIIPGTDELETNPDLSLNLLSKYGLSTLGLEDIDITDETRFAAAYFDLDTSRILLGRDGKMEIYSSSQLTPVPIVLLRCLLLILALGLAELIVVLVVRRTRRHGSVVSKLLAALLPIMVLICVCSSGFVSVFLAYYNQLQVQKTMEGIAQQLISLGIHKDVEKIADQFPIRSSDTLAPEEMQLYRDTYTNLMLIQQDLRYQPDILDGTSQQTVSNQMRCDVTYYIRNPETNTYYSLDNSMAFLSFDEWMSPKQTDLFRSKIEGDNHVTFRYYTIWNQKMSGLICTTRLDNGEISGFYLISADQIEGDNQIIQIIQRFILYQLSVCLLLLALFTPIVYFSLKPLSALRRKAKQLTDGVIPSFSPARAGLRNEITDLDDTFQQLVSQVDDNLKRMNRLQDLSKAYFSPQILRLLGRTRVSQLTFDEAVTRPLYIAYLALGEMTFDEIQQLVTRCVPLLEPCDGFFAGVTGEEIVLVSQQPGLFYAAAAAAQERKELRAAFDYTSVTVRISGSGSEYRFLVAPENENRKDALCAYRDTLGCRLLAFEQPFFAEQTDLNGRIVGYLGEQALVEFFLDAFANEYRLGQKDLETGIRLFFQGEQELARTSFVQALRVHPGDRVALYYIRLIDAGTVRPQKEEGS